MKTVTVKQIQKLDDLAINKYGMPSIALMENAGCKVAEHVIKLLKNNTNARVCVVCGTGNNAGDGFVAARHLINAGIHIDIYMIGEAANLKNDAALNYNILRRLTYPISPVKKVDAGFHKSIVNADLLIDAIFGVGLNREIKDPFYSVIAAMNQSKKKIIAVDTPSGLDCTTGKIYGICIKARQTVTFSFVKTGHMRLHGPKQAGRIVVADIGIPLKLKLRIK